MWLMIQKQDLMLTALEVDIVILIFRKTKSRLGIDAIGPDLLKMGGGQDLNPNVHFSQCPHDVGVGMICSWRERTLFACWRMRGIHENWSHPAVPSL